MGRTSYLVDRFFLTDIQGDAYLGREGGERVMRDLLAAQRSIEIVAPGASSAHHEQLAQLAKRGVKVSYATLMPSTSKDAISIGTHLMNVNLYSYNEKIAAYMKHHKKSEKLRFWKRFCNVCAIVSLVLALISGILLFASVRPDLVTRVFPGFSAGMVPFILNALIIATGVAASLSLIFLVVSRLLKRAGKRAGRQAEEFIPYLYSWEYTTTVDFKLFPNAEQRRLYSMRDGLEAFPLLNMRIYIIDGAVAYVGSADFTSPSLESSLEVMVRIMDTYTITELQNYVRTLMVVNDPLVVTPASFADYFIHTYQMTIYSYPDGVTPKPGIWSIYNRTVDVGRVAQEYYEEGFAQGVKSTQALPVVEELKNYMGSA